MYFLRLFAIIVLLKCFADHKVLCAEKNTVKEMSNNTGTNVVLYDNKSDQKEDGPADINIKMHFGSLKTEDVKRLMKAFQNPNETIFFVALDDGVVYKLFQRKNR
eukprot:380086_1